MLNFRRLSVCTDRLVKVRNSHIDTVIQPGLIIIAWTLVIDSMHGMEHGSHLSLCHKEPAEARNAPSTGLWVTSAGSGIRGLVWQHHDLTQSVHNLPMRVLHSALPQ